MVKLLCAVVGVAGSAFEVDIDEGASVSALKEAIKGKNEDFTVPARKLQLFLARKDGKWLTQKLTEKLTEKDVANSATFTDGLTELDVWAAPLLLVGLSETEVQYQVTLEHIRTKSTHVNVLVVLPSKMLRIGVDETYADKIFSYMEIAERLKDSEEVRSLSDHVAQVIADGQSPTPFVVLENSSGTGKTQMAFNLQARGECDVFYIVCGTAGDREQTVYTAYAERTSAFQGCVRRDLDALKRVTLDERAPLGAVGQIRGHTTLALYAFILAALRGQDEFCGEARRSDVIAELEKRGKKPFVFFLDEFPRAGRIQTHRDDMGQRELANSLRMMRNVFRSFKLAVVVSSTNGTARNLVTTSSRSRESEPYVESYVWCVVVPSFPRVVLNGDAAVPALVMKIISHSRPLFAQIAVQYVQANPYMGGRDVGDYLNAMASALAPRFRSFKKRTNEFEMGQLCLLLCTSYQMVDDKVNMIDRHFARLQEQAVFELQLDAHGQLWKGGGAWECSCVLPPPEEDMLLHLTMAGGPSFRPFDKRLHEVMSKIQPPVHCDNTEQRSNDGMRLEALTAAAVVLASHAGGFGGVAFPTFLRELLFELGVCEPGMTLQLPQDVKNAGAGDMIVPFLAPPNAKWPEWVLTDSSTRFANLVRTRTEDGIDFRASYLISGECKDYSSAVNLDVMKKILVRIPAESPIHLVVVNTLQTEYFTAESSWEEFVREHSLQNVGVYRVSKGSKLREIQRMSNKSGAAALSHLASSTATMARRFDKLVLFIELG